MGSGDKKVNGCGNYYCHIKGSDAEDFRDIKPGYIFLWKKVGGSGHVGVVEHVILDEEDPSEDLVIILEAISSSGSQDESTCRNFSNSYGFPYQEGGKVRRSIYKRTGKALVSHVGWKGYFKAKDPETGTGTETRTGTENRPGAGTETGPRH